MASGGSQTLQRPAGHLCAGAWIVGEASHDLEGARDGLALVGLGPALQEDQQALTRPRACRVVGNLRQGSLSTARQIAQAGAGW